MGRCPRTIFRVLSLVLLLLGLEGGVVRAEGALDDERARAHYIAGESHFAAGRWADAAREFTLAYELSQREEMLINRSRAFERDNRLSEARADLVLLLERHPDTRYRAEAETRLDRLSRQLAAAPPPSTSEASAAHVEPQREPAPVVASSPSGPAPAPGATRMLHWPVLALGGGALIAGAVALGTGLRAHAIYEDLARACPDDTCPAARADDRDHGRTLARASTGLTLGAVALLGGAIGVYVRARRRPAPVAVDVEARAQGAAARLRVQF